LPLIKFSLLGIYGLTENSKEDFVYYANANTEEEAKSLCESLPFLSSKLYPLIILM
jgi:hypothetical protein